MVTLFPMIPGPSALVRVALQSPDLQGRPLGQQPVKAVKGALWSASARAVGSQSLHL